MNRLPPLDADTLRRHDVAGPRYTSYPTVPEWSDRYGATDFAAALERAGAATPDKPVSLYIHIPFCQEMCTYCGCNVVVTRDRAKADRYLEAVGQEAALVAARLGARRLVSRIHLGGGTPTFLDERQLTALWNAITASFTVLPTAELSVEIDPVVTRLEQLALLAGYGFRRLSMGVQDFDAQVQQAVRRIQSVEDTRRMIDGARELGYRSVNLDLIYGLPYQTPESIDRTAAQIVALHPDRIAAFSFAFVPEVRTHQKRLPVAQIPGGVEKFELFRRLHDGFADAGYRAIGLDHFALPGDELAVAQEKRTLWRDFQGYMTDAGVETVALGITGISDLGVAYAQNGRPILEYEATVAAGTLPTARGMTLSDDDLRRRRVITQLMCNLEVDLGADAATHFPREMEAMARHRSEGLVTVDGTRITLTPLGRIFMRNVAMEFDAYLAPTRADRPVFSRTI